MHSHTYNDRICPTSSIHTDQLHIETPTRYRHMNIQNPTLALYSFNHLLSTLSKAPHQSTSSNLCLCQSSVTPTPLGSNLPLSNHPHPKFKPPYWKRHCRHHLVSQKPFIILDYLKKNRDCYNNQRCNHHFHTFCRGNGKHQDTFLEYFLQIFFAILSQW